LKILSRSALSVLCKCTQHRSFSVIKNTEDRIQNSNSELQIQFRFRIQGAELTRYRLRTATVEVVSRQSASLVDSAIQYLVVISQKLTTNNCHICQLPTANCKLPTATANCKLQRQLPLQLQLNLPTANCNLPTADCRLRRQLPTATALPTADADCQRATGRRLKLREGPPIDSLPIMSLDRALLSFCRRVLAS